MWLYQKFAATYHVGFYTPDGLADWITESEWKTKEEAALRVRWLNGGNVENEKTEEKPPWD